MTEDKPKVLICGMIGNVVLIHRLLELQSTGEIDIIYDRLELDEEDIMGIEISSAYEGELGDKLVAGGADCLAPKDIIYEGLVDEDVYRPLFNTKHQKPWYHKGRW